MADSIFFAAIGSGSGYAVAAVKALMEHNPQMSAEEIARNAMKIAAEMCIYTNNNVIIEVLDYSNRMPPPPPSSDK